jgi:hypothetical protein
VLRGCLVVLIAGGAGAEPSGGALRLACFAPSWTDDAQVALLCRAVGDGMAERLGRAVVVVEGPADVALEVIRLEERLVVGRLHWPDTPPGPEVQLGGVDAALGEVSYRMMAAGLLQASPPP